MATHHVGFAAVLAAVYGRLTTAAGTSGYSTYNSPPSTLTFPYVTVGGLAGQKSLEWTSRDIKGEDVVIMVSVWSSYKGDKECSEMMDAIAEALTATDLTISGYTILKMVLDFSSVEIDNTNPGELLRHGVMRFRVHIA